MSESERVLPPMTAEDALGDLDVMPIADIPEAFITLGQEVIQLAPGGDGCVTVDSIAKAAEALSLLQRVVWVLRGESRE